MLLGAGARAAAPAAAAAPPDSLRVAANDPDGSRETTGDGSLVRTDLAEADAAFERGDHERALALYQEFLHGLGGAAAAGGAAAEEGARELRALRRVGLLLGWAGRSGEAAPVLDRAVRLDPAERPTRLQLARVYSWSEQYGPSLKTYDALLAEDPADTPTAIERARVLSWSGQLSEAESAYRRILAQDAGNTQASLGLGQCLGWQGRLDESEAVYRDLQGRDPAAARLGLGRLDLWRGNALGALKAARAALTSDPSSKEARDLEQAARARMRPSLNVASEASRDTDDNEVVAATASASFHPEWIPDIDISVASLRTEGRDLEAQRLGSLDADGNASTGFRPFIGRRAEDIRALSVQTAALFTGFPAGAGGRVLLGIAAERLGSFERAKAPGSLAPPRILLEDRGTETSASGYAAYRVVLARIGLRVTAAREIPKWTTFVAQKSLRLDHIVAALDGPLPWKIAWAVALDAGRITAGAADNSRRTAVVRAWKRFELGGGAGLAPRYAFRYLAYARNLNDGYFDPQRFVSNIVGAELSGKLAHKRLEWALNADVGLEKFRMDQEDDAVCDVFANAADAAACRARAGDSAPHPGAAGYLRSKSDSDTNTALGYGARLTWTAGDRVSIEATVSRNESAAQTAAGFTSRSFGLSARIGF